MNYKKYQDQGLTMSEILELRNHISNWSKLSARIYKEDISEIKLLCMIDLEKIGRNRRHLLNRLYSRYNKLRTAREKAELFKDLDNET